MDFSFDNDRPVYLQLVEQLRAALLSGVYHPGQRLPSVRDLSAAAKVNPNTMQRALSQLEDEGLLFTERTNGKFVTLDEARIATLREALAESMTREYLSRLRRIGLSKSDAITALTNIGGDEECL